MTLPPVGVNFLTHMIYFGKKLSIILNLSAQIISFYSSPSFTFIKPNNQSREQVANQIVAHIQSINLCFLHSLLQVNNEENAKHLL